MRRRPGPGGPGRRRALPTGRAVVGGFAVAAAVVIVFVGWADARGSTGQAWVVAARPLAAGSLITKDDIAMGTLRLGNGATALDAFGSGDALVGRTLAVPVAAGELILRPEIRVAATGVTLRPVPATVAPTDLVDLAPGDLVDVLETSGTAPRTTTSVVVGDAHVLSTAQPSSGLLGSGGTDVVTLGVSTLSQVEAVIAADHAGTVDLVVGEPSDATGSGAGTGGTGTASSAVAGSGGRTAAA